jgi:hypothetical protein
MGLGRLASTSITHTDLHKPNNKLVSAQLKHFWCTDESWANLDSQNSPRPKFGVNHHLPPYSILYAWPQGQHSNDILSQDSQVTIPKFPKFGFPQLWRLITLCENLRWRWGLSKIVALVKSFPTICGTRPACKEIKTILDF